MHEKTSVTNIQYRARSDIVFAILETIEDADQVQNKVIFGAELSYAQLRQYSSYMVENGFVTIQTNDDNKNVWHITEKGKKYLSILRKEKALMMEVVS